LRCLVENVFFVNVRYESLSRRLWSRLLAAGPRSLSGPQAFLADLSG